MEFYLLFPGLEKSWNLTAGFGKFLKVMEIMKNPLAEPHGLIPILNPAHHDGDIDMSRMKVEVNLIFVITLCLTD